MKLFGNLLEEETVKGSFLFIYFQFLLRSIIVLAAASPAGDIKHYDMARFQSLFITTLSPLIITKLKKCSSSLISLEVQNLT